MSSTGLSARFRGITITDPATGQVLQRSRPTKGTLQGRSVAFKAISNATRLPSKAVDIINGYAKDSDIELLLKLTFIELVKPELQTDIREKASAWLSVDTKTMDYGSARIDINCGFLPLRGLHILNFDKISRATSFLESQLGPTTGYIDVPTPKIFPLLAKKVHEAYYQNATALINPLGQSHKYTRTENGTRFEVCYTGAQTQVEAEEIFKIEGGERVLQDIPAVCVRACPVNSYIEDFEEDSSSRARNSWVMAATDQDPRYLVTVDLQPVTPTGRMLRRPRQRDDRTVELVNEMGLDVSRSPEIRITCHTGKENPVVVLESEIRQLPKEFRERPLSVAPLLGALT